MLDVDPLMFSRVGQADVIEKMKRVVARELTGSEENAGVEFTWQAQSAGSEAWERADPDGTWPRGVYKFRLIGKVGT